MRHGYGKQIINNVVYIGQFVKDKMCGEGFEKYLDQEDDEFIYQGGFLNDLRHGFGEINYCNSDTYKGKMILGVPHGFGEIYKCRTGNVYRGF